MYYPIWLGILKIILTICEQEKIDFTFNSNKYSDGYYDMIALLNNMIKKILLCILTILSLTNLVLAQEVVSAKKSFSPIF